MRRLKAFMNEDAPATPAPVKQSKIPMDVHEVLDFYKSHSVEIKAILRTMGGTNRNQQMFMLGYYIGYAKR